MFGEIHMDHLCKDFCEHYHQERPQQGLENDILTTKVSKRKGKPVGKSNEMESPPIIRLSDLRCKERLGGLLKSYSHKAA